MVYELALVTGATSGIGLQISELLALKGVNLILTGRNQEQLHTLKHQLSKKVNVQTLTIDLAQSGKRSHLIEVIHEQIPDLIINNAGFGLYGEVLTYETTDQLDLLEVNGKAVLEITLEAARALISMKKKGVILNVSSSAAFQIMPNLAVYAASKTFVNQFSQAFDFEVKHHGVRVLTICPGMVATKFQQRAGGKINQKQFGVLTASYVASQMWKQINRLNPLSIVDWKYRVLTFITHFIPKNWIASFTARIIAKRTKHRTLITKIKNEPR